MKKLISFIAFTLVTFTANAQSYCYDTNGDGEINIADVTCLVNKILDIPIPGTALGPVTFKTNAQSYCYDTNGDGEINIADVTCLVNKILGINNPGEITPAYLNCPDDQHPHLIDLGLPSGTKWACCNMGANKPEAYGSYYAWGETEEKSTYDWSNYIHCDGSSQTCHDLGSDIIRTQYDVAHVRWDVNWVMPTLDLFEELLNNCTYEWTTENGVAGGKFTSKINNSSIFLPAAGQRYDSDLSSTGSIGRYWTSTQHTTDMFNAYNFSFDSDLAYWGYFGRYHGGSVRPVVTNYDPLQVSSNELPVIIGKQETVEINSGSGYYSVENSDANIATVTYSGSTITVTAVGWGKTTITVKDIHSREMTTIEVKTYLPSYTTCPDDHHPHLIDLGLPSGTKWACCNVGNDKPEASDCHHYSWGETKEKSNGYVWETYSHCDGSDATCHDLGSDIAGTQYDVAHVKWGGYWVMPSFEQFEELINNCTYEWTTLNGVICAKYTSKNNNGCIILPASGENNDVGLYDVGSSGIYWSSTQSPEKANRAYGLHIYSTYTGCYKNYYRCFGYSIRPVVRKY